MFKNLKFYLWLLIILGVIALGVCAVKYNSNKSDMVFNEKMKISTLSGPTGFSLAYLFNNDNYEMDLNDAPDMLSAKLISGESMFATIPTNMAAILNNKTNGKIKILSVISLGNLYVLSNDDNINDVNDLAGCTIYLSGKGATPEVIAEDLLSYKDITFNYLGEHAECVANMKQGKANVILLPEPYVSIAKGQIENLHVVCDINEMWKEKYDLDLPMSCLVYNRDFVLENDCVREEKLNEIEQLLKDVKKSINEVNKVSDETIEIIESNKIIAKEGIAKLAIPNCNIKFIEYKDAKEMINKYFEIINNVNPKLIGGSIPSEENFN